MHRRDFLGDLARYAAMSAVVPTAWRVTRRPVLVDDPFTLGVASGDPTADGATIWTRLAPRPLEPGGGMSGQRAVVSWEVATDDAFAQIVARGRATAVPELAHSVHIDVARLQPARWYFYRFSVGGATSPVGRLRTTPAASAAITPLSFAFVSCQHYEQGYYTAYRHLAREDLDLVAHLGDYIYEYAAIGGRPRSHAAAECIALDEYRARYAQYKSDADLQAAHRRCPWVVTWDDHEVDNNYAGTEGENYMESVEQMRARRAAGYQAWWEHQPVKVPRARSWADLDIARSISWGALARFWVVDTRQFRTDHACDGRAGAHIAPCADWMNPARQMMGPAQERWLFDGLARSRARWQVLANQVMMAPLDTDPGPERKLSMESWNGYPVARERVLNAIATHAPGRTMVLTGDIHSSWVCDLHRSELRGSARAPQAPVVATELIGTSISSGGDGADAWASPAVLADNPHIKWHNARRGYVSCTVTADDWRTSYRTVPYVSKPDAPVETPAQWRSVHGRAGVERV